jgi:hypothetical protein
MRAERGVSQILFGMLPGQTVDLQGSVWRVSYWEEPIPLSIDPSSVRQVLLAAARPWTLGGKDDGLANDLHAQAPVEVVGVHKDRGVVVEPFPRQWRCRSCGRLSHERPQTCSTCGSAASSQMHFVAYHTCGALREPWFPRCPVHSLAAVRLPGTARATDLRFFCPTCKRRLGKGYGYGFQPCECDRSQGMSINVHRAGVVFSPQFAVLVNPPDPGAAARLREQGGGARALEWILEGMAKRDPGTGQQTVEGFVESLMRQGLSSETAREFAEKAADRGEVRRGSAPGDLHIPADARDLAQEEALSIKSAIDGGCVLVSDMVEGTTPPLQFLYQRDYPRALERAQLRDVRLLTDFPVATLAFGYTRGDQEPGKARLVTFRDRGTIRAYGTLAKTEALLFQLDPCAVHRYLTTQGFSLDPAGSEREARLAILRGLDVPFPLDEHPQQFGRAVVTLMHSYAHRAVRTLAVVAGIERDSLAEYLLPHHLGFIIYAAARGDFVLGGLQAVFETSLQRVLDDIVTAETRCPLDPGCRTGGGACMACLHLGEPSCRWFNRFLNRDVMFGEHGFLRSSGGG